MKQIHPSLGDGFIKACLAVSHWSVERAVDVLFQPDPLPYPLDVLDRTLGDVKRRDEPPVEERDEAFVRVQKQYLRKMEREEVSTDANKRWRHST